MGTTCSSVTELDDSDGLQIPAAESDEFVVVVGEVSCPGKSSGPSG